MEKLLPKNPAKTEEDESSDGYKAFGVSATQDRQLRIDIRDWKGNSWFYSYSYIIRIQCTGDQFISLVSTDSIVTLEGENLSSLKRYFQNELIVYVQEFNSQRWPAPDAGDPVISKIDIWEAASMKMEEETEA